MSGSAALEYGFPSTHSANAVSVAVYGLFLLRAEDNPLSANTRAGLEVLAYFYAISIIFGRLYCGMHGFLDVIVGSIMGAAIGVLEYDLGPVLDEKLMASSWIVPVAVGLVLILMIRIHPEPADDCPCFDDSIAFAGVCIGLEAGTWRLARSSFAYILPPERVALPDGTYHDALVDPFATARALGWPKMVARVVSGVVIIFLWREVMKPLLLRVLPHVFRLLETRKMDMPRRFFTRAHKYKNIPLRLQMDTVMPNVSDIPKIISSFRGPGRGRSVSVGPQSAADAYETLAYRERRRRESVGSNGSLRSKSSLYDLQEEGKQMMNGNSGDRGAAGTSTAREASNGRKYQQQKSPIEMYEQMMGQGRVRVGSTSPAPTARDEYHDNEKDSGVVSFPSYDDEAASRLLAKQLRDEGGDVDDTEDEPEIYISRENELGEREVFSRLMRPRVRYDVEVVTKLVVYTGISWLSVDLIPILFEFIGLGVSHYR